MSQLLLQYLVLSLPQSVQNRQTLGHSQILASCSLVFMVRFLWGVSHSFLIPFSNLPSPGPSREPQCFPLPCDSCCKDLWVYCKSWIPAALLDQLQDRQAFVSVSNWFLRVTNTLVSFFLDACSSCIDFLQFVIRHTGDSNRERGFFCYS